MLTPQCSTLRAQISTGRRPTVSLQQRRLADELRELLARALADVTRIHAQAALRAEDRWWSGAAGRTLRELVQQSFRTRQLLRSTVHEGTWRNAQSYIGFPDRSDARWSTHEYERAELLPSPGSAPARPPAWAAGQPCCVLPASSGMSAIAAWLWGLGRVAAERGEDVLLLTNELYYETTHLLRVAAPPRLRVSGHLHADDLLARLRRPDGPIAVLVDSTYPGGSAAAVGRILTEVDPAKTLCVAWDSTCVELDEGPRLRDDHWRVPLVALRSHPKLDQLGLELCSFGSVTFVGASTSEDEPRDPGSLLWFATSTVMEVTGLFAPGYSFRLLARLGLPDPGLAADGNASLRAANARVADGLAEALDHRIEYEVRAPEHGCFVNLHLLAHAPDRCPALNHDIAAIETLAEAHHIPAWRSDSFGFHYTSLSAYPVRDRAGEPDHVVLRIGVGMHDEDVAGRLVTILATHLLGRPR